MLESQDAARRLFEVAGEHLDLLLSALEERAQLVALSHPQVLVHPIQVCESTLTTMSTGVAKLRGRCNAGELHKIRVAVGWVLHLQVDEPLEQHSPLLVDLELEGAQPLFELRLGLLDLLLPLLEGR